mmetsp:Transcript_19343/g.32342  ORF Transcript_19343/g.32342 Transcript_19343/m.32342 type:complete len:190 (+) Transcript_19343:41-610(+)|eukprot:CAMPEP_0174971392 /NCGR_PEP_ID=MMETSP0004_2-20121128/9963_1 /TAXON_ID=420556 /ORGANISM="Ochromonas sp., Strain CCMP1393" /LENGTH=189 /DNA_ID=CAMNT_0016221329 /DNA_START=17 /DNA_END=586 /DNA_ORIENTATION=-
MHLIHVILFAITPLVVSFRTRVLPAYKVHALLNRELTPTVSSQQFRNNIACYSAENSEETEDPEELVKKYGLEAGMLKAVASTDDKSKIKPKDLLAKYGIAYLATSITLAIISYAICYALISNGVDVASLLEKVGIQSSGAASNAGTAAIAYAVHKAASPIRFPPTVALTPVVAGWLGKSPSDKDQTEE